MTETPERKGSYIGQAWLVILLALLYGGALASVQTTLGPKIAENKRNETFDKIPDLVPGADRDKTLEENTDKTFELAVIDGKQPRVYRAVDAGGALKGWVLPASGQGFADRIELLIGLSAELSVITGIYVLDQKETPGLGNFIADEPFRSQFADKPTDEPLVVVKGDPVAGNEIQALTGATISSDSVAKIINDAVANLKRPIEPASASASAGPINTEGE